MKRIEVSTQGELDAALKSAKPADLVVCVGSAQFTVSGSASVEARESASVVARESARVVARGSARVVARESARVEARGSARVVARESASVVAWGSARVEAWESARVVAWGSASVEAWGSASVEAWGSASVEAWESASVVASGSARVEARESARVDLAGKHTIALLHSAEASVTGRGTTLRLDTVEEWADYYGVEITDGVLVLYKALDADYRSPYGMSYAPGTTPEALDWDPTPECGGGLHFSPHPRLARDFNESAARYMACPVSVEDVVVPWPANYPNKVKARRVCAPCWEVDIDGQRVEIAATVPNAAYEEVRR